jgi:hypothetical protein
MRYIQWCLLCQERERNGRSDHCAHCQAEMQVLIERLEAEANG